MEHACYCCTSLKSRLRELDMVAMVSIGWRLALCRVEVWQLEAVGEDGF